MDTLKPKKGLAAMTDERRREIASMGGKAAHKKGVGHVFTSAEASAAGRRSAEKRWGKKYV